MEPQIKDNRRPDRKIIVSRSANYLIPLLFMCAVLFAWQAIVVLLDVQRWFVPAPTDIAKTLVEVKDVLAVHAQSSLIGALTGFLAALIVALVLSLLIDRSSLIKKAIYPLLVASQTVPIIALAPLLIVWFGFGMLPKVIIVALVCFFPIVVSMVDGLESADEDMVDMLRVMGASRWQVFRMVRFPGALVSIFSGLKIAATYSVMGAVIGEWAGAKKGLGLYMTLAQHSWHTDRLFAAIVVITAASLILFGIIELSARVIMPWNYAKTDSWGLSVQKFIERKVANGQKG